MLLAVTMAAACAQQPIAFPHNQHVKMGLDCIDCHIGADTRADAGIPSINKCMLCHAKLGRDKAEVKKVIDYANQKIEIPWQRVYEFAPSAHVKFKHAPALSSRYRLRDVSRRHDAGNGGREAGKPQHGFVPHLPSPK